MRLKQPAETVRLTVPFAGTVTAIVAIAVTARGNVAELVPLSIAAQQFGGTEVSFTAAGGTGGEEYLIEVQATVAGLLNEARTELLVEDLGFAVPAVASPYLGGDEFVNRLGLDLAIRLTDTEGAGRIDAVRLASALADATATVNSYLAGRYAIPIAPVPPDLTGLTYDLAVDRLWAGSADVPDRIGAKASEARRALGDYSAGKRVFPGSGGLTTVAPVEQVLIEAPARTFTRSRLRGL